MVITPWSNMFVAEDPLLILGYISVLVKLLVGNVLFFFSFLWPTSTFVKS